MRALPRSLCVCSGLLVRSPRSAAGTSERLQGAFMTHADSAPRARRYARGILFGKMVLELGDSSIVRNETLGLSCEVEFKTKVRLSALSVLGSLSSRRRERAL